LVVPSSIRPASLFSSEVAGGPSSYGRAVARITFPTLRDPKEAGQEFFLSPCPSFPSLGQREVLSFLCRRVGGLLRDILPFHTEQLVTLPFLLRWRFLFSEAGLVFFSPRWRRAVKPFATKCRFPPFTCASTIRSHPPFSSFCGSFFFHKHVYRFFTGPPSS